MIFDITDSKIKATIPLDIHDLYFNEDMLNSSHLGSSSYSEDVIVDNYFSDFYLFELNEKAIIEITASASFTPSIKLWKYFSALTDELIEISQDGLYQIKKELNKGRYVIELTTKFPNVTGKYQLALTKTSKFKFIAPTDPDSNYYDSFEWIRRYSDYRFDIPSTWNMGSIKKVTGVGVSISETPYSTFYSTPLALTKEPKFLGIVTDYVTHENRPYARVQTYGPIQDSKWNFSGPPYGQPVYSACTSMDEWNTILLNNSHNLYVIPKILTDQSNLSTLLTNVRVDENYTITPEQGYDLTWFDISYNEGVVYCYYGAGWDGIKSMTETKINLTGLRDVLELAKKTNNVIDLSKTKIIISGHYYAASAGYESLTINVGPGYTQSQLLDPVAGWMQEAFSVEFNVGEWEGMFDNPSQPIWIMLYAKVNENYQSSLSVSIENIKLKFFLRDEFTNGSKILEEIGYTLSNDSFLILSSGGSEAVSSYTEKSRSSHLYDGFVTTNDGLFDISLEFIDTIVMETDKGKEVTFSYSSPGGG